MCEELMTRFEMYAAKTAKGWIESALKEEQEGKSLWIYQLS